MTKKKPRRSVDEGDQQDLEGTRVLNRKVEGPVKKYVEALGQRQAWQADENNAREKAMEAMEAEGLRVYFLKSGHKIELVDKGSKLKVASPKDEDGKAETPDRQTSLGVSEVG